jgi:hypothetical protein
MMREIVNRVLGKASRRERGWRCPDENRLAAFIDAQLDDSTRERLLIHLENCSYCCDQVAAVVRLQSGGKAPIEVPPELLVRTRALAEQDRSAQRMPVLRWGTAAVAVASLILVATVAFRRPHVPPEAPSAQPSPPETSSPAPSLPTSTPAAPRLVRNLENATGVPQVLYPREGDVVSPEAVEFRWKRVRGALSYDVRVLTEDGNLVWEGRAEDATIRVPATIQLTDGGSFYVRVRALLPEGKTVTSKVVGFKIKSSS